jgi:hypothetical protein
MCVCVCVCVCLYVFFGFFFWGDTDEVTQGFTGTLPLVPHPQFPLIFLSGSSLLILTTLLSPTHYPLKAKSLSLGTRWWELTHWDPRLKKHLKYVRSFQEGTVFSRGSTGQKPHRDKGTVLVHSPLPITLRIHTTWKQRLAQYTFLFRRLVQKLD